MLKVKGGKSVKGYSVQMVTKHSKGAILLSDKIDFRSKTITRDK